MGKDYSSKFLITKYVYKICNFANINIFLTDQQCVNRQTTQEINSYFFKEIEDISNELAESETEMKIFANNRGIKNALKYEIVPLKK